MSALQSAGIDLYWLPLGAGGHSVKWNGRAFELASALAQRRRPADLYHSAMTVNLPPHTYAIEMTPVWRVPDVDRGVVAEGAVGAAWAGRWSAFRYEVHCWRGGEIGDVAEAVASPMKLSSSAAVAEQMLMEIRSVPAPVWGRDDLGTGEMWNSNSVTSWALVRCGLDVHGLNPPSAGRAPGWAAGIAVA